MAIAERLISMIAQWARGAQTNIPNPPVPGIAYRNADLAATDIESGQSYDKVYDSARYNQIDFLATGLVQGVEQYGILPYSSLTNYPESGICMGLDGVLYQALQPSGPANGGAQPTTNSAYWREYAPPNVLTLDYFLCTKIFKSIHPTPKPGMVPVNGTLLTDAATRYPQAFAYLQSAEGQQLCTTEALWQAANVAVWATLASGEQIGWDRIGGVCKYVIDVNAGTIRVPDLRGMTDEVAGFDSLGVGGVQGDGIPDVQGTIDAVGAGNTGGPFNAASGAFAVSGGVTSPLAVGSGVSRYRYINFSLASHLPVANKVQTRAWGALACVYLGRPAS